MVVPLVHHTASCSKKELISCSSNIIGPVCIRVPDYFVWGVPHCTRVPPSFTVVMSSGLASVDAIFTTLSFTIFSHWRKVDSPCLNLWASAVISEGYCFRHCAITITDLLVSSHPRDHAAYQKNFVCATILESVHTSLSQCHISSRYKYVCQHKLFPLHHTCT